MSDWPQVAFEDIVAARGSGASGLPQSEWLAAGKYPVIGQGAESIEGWTDRGDLLLKPAPAVVLYGGHTRRAKYVNTPFVPGPNVKILEPARRLDAKFLYRFLEQLHIESRGYADHFPAVRRCSIPVPPLVEQHRISAILDQAEELKAKRRKALAQLDSITQSIFIEMFGDYRTERTQWPTLTVEEIAAEMTIGLVRSASEFGPDFETPYVRMNAIGQRGEFLPGLVMRTDVGADEFERYALKPGDLLFNTRNSRELVGKTALFRETGPYVFNNNLMRIRFKAALHPEYVAAAFQTPFVQQELEIRKAGTTSVFAIYARELKTVPIPVPPLTLQQAFATRIQAVESLKASHRAALTECDALFASLQHRAFAGQLS